MFTITEYLYGLDLPLSYIFLEDQQPTMLEVTLAATAAQDVLLASPGLTVTVCPYGGTPVPLPVTGTLWTLPTRATLTLVQDGSFPAGWYRLALFAATTQASFFHAAPYHLMPAAGHLGQTTTPVALCVVQVSPHLATRLSTWYPVARVISAP